MQFPGDCFILVMNQSSDVNEFMIANFLNWNYCWVRVPGYRSRSLGFDSRRYQIFWEVVGLKWGPLGLVSTIEELLERNNNGSGLETGNMATGIHCHGRLVSIVGFNASLVIVLVLYYILYVSCINPVTCKTDDVGNWRKYVAYFY
jgi:hypothetical protein